MSKFNSKTKVQSTKTVNLAGGEAYQQSTELELVSILLTSFVQNTYYRSADDTMKRLIELLDKVNPEFAAKAAVYARDKFGMRSITHVLAAEVAKYVSGKSWAKNFYESVVSRPDDMTEIVSYYFSKNGDKLPGSLKKGFAKAFNKFDAYQLAKYRGDSKDVSLVDIVNLVHPSPVEKNKEALKALVAGSLKNENTWEAKLSEAGKKASSTEEKTELKKEAWAELINTRKIGYLALLRNIRNILTDAPELSTQVAALLTDEKLIRKSKVFPFQFVTALQEVEKIGSKQSREVVVAINKAVDISCANVPKLDGETLVVLDVSGSMTGKPAEIGSLFSAVLAKSNNCDFMTFSDNAQYRTINIADSTITIARGMRFAAGGTNFHSIFQRANKKYDNIFILSDMQGWVGYNAPTAAFNEYKRKYNANPFIYSFDLNGGGTMQFPENKVFAIAGFSEKVFDVIALLQQDKKALVNDIKNSIKFE